MKKIIILSIATLTALTFGGCRATPSVASTVAQMYDTTKTVWVKGQEIVVINSDLLSPSTLRHLNKIDERAKRMIETKNIVNDINIVSENKERVSETLDVITR